MIDTLDGYIRRSLPEGGGFSTNPNLLKKVAPTGKLLPYRGNTVVFLLEERIRLRLGQIRDTLYYAAPDMLAEKLRTETFHMTLHDLANGCGDDWTLNNRMAEAERRTRDILSRWKRTEPLHMKATWLFNMVNTSIVLGLAPADGNSWHRLDEMYTGLEAAVPLGYALTPHITMAYFRPGTYAQEQVRRLQSALQGVELDVSLSMEDLALQSFKDMNRYETVMQVGADGFVKPGSGR